MWTRNDAVARTLQNLLHVTKREQPQKPYSLYHSQNSYCNVLQRHRLQKYGISIEQISEILRAVAVPKPPLLIICADSFYYYYYFFMSDHSPRFTHGETKAVSGEIEKFNAFYRVPATTPAIRQQSSSPP